MGRRTVAAALAALASLAMASMAQAQCQLQKVADLQVTMAGGRVVVPAKINGQDVKLAVDSGAFFSMVTPAAKVKYKMIGQVAPINLQISGVGGGGGFASLAVAKDFSFLGVEQHDVEFLQGERGLGDGIDGLLGQNYLAVFDVEYDLPDGVIRLFAPKNCHDAALAYWAGPSGEYSVIPLASGDNDHDVHTYGEAAINGVPIRAIFDTGAPVSSISLSAAARAGVKPGDPGVTEAGYASGIGAGSFLRAWQAPFASFKIGDEEIKNFKLMIGDMRLVGGDMLIGDDFFRSHRILVSNSQRKIYFTYSGGPVFEMKMSPSGSGAQVAPPLDAASAAAPPPDAEAYSRLAAADSARNDFAGAVADLTKAIALSPSEPRYYLARGLADERLLGDPAKPPPVLPMADFDAALKLKPDNVPVLLARSGLYMLRRQPDLARADLDAADKAAANDPDQRLNLAGAYGRQGLDKQALAELDQWIDSHPTDDRLATALDARCRVRGLLAQDLDKALADCNTALKLEPRDPATLQSRGLVRLRLGDFDGSIGDYNASIRIAPNEAWSLYGRGLAKLKKGQTADGQADLKAAAAIHPQIAADAAKRGLTP